MTSWTAAAVDKLTAAGVARAYALGSVPASPGYPYVVVMVSRDDALSPALAGGHDLVRWRVTTQTFGRQVEQVEHFDGLAFKALQDQQLVAAIECGPCDLQVSAPTRDPDDGGVLGVTSSYLFNATREIS